MSSYLCFKTNIRGNRGQVRLSGLELKAGWSVSRATQLRLGYGYTRGTDLRTGQPVNSVNPAQWLFSANHRLAHWTLGLHLNHVQAKASKDIDRASVPLQFATPSHTTLDLKAQWQAGRQTRVSLALNNLTDRKYWTWTNVRGVRADDPALDAYTAPGRSLAVALTQLF